MTGAVSYQSIAGLPVDSAIKDDTCLQWVVCIGLDLADVYNNKQQVHYAQ